MLPYPPNSETLSVFDAHVRALHVAPANGSSYHQWHYAVDAELLALVNHWHATGQVQHVTLLDMYFDDKKVDGSLQRDGARLRLRRLSGHSERRPQRSERRGDWSLREFKHQAKGATLWGIERDPHNIMADLVRLHKIEADGRPNPTPMTYCPAATSGGMRHRYGPKHVSNPRWWIDNGRVLVVEADPGARGWASDDEEVIEYNKPDDAYESDRVTEHPACCACVPVELPEYKDGHMKLLPGLPVPDVWGSVEIK